MWLAVQGKGPSPIELHVSDVCREFGCLPTRALWELEHDPDQLALRVMLVRDFLRTRAEIDRAIAAEKDDLMPTGPMADMALEIEAEVTRAATEQAIAQRLAELEAETEP